MNKTLAGATQFIQDIKDSIPAKDVVEAVVCAPAVFLSALVKETEGTDIAIGAQNMYFEESGAFTGEISPIMLKDLGVHYVILGHSERRALFAETDEMVNKKTQAAFDHGLVPIVCVGETLEEREAGKTYSLVEAQVTEALKGLNSEQVKAVIVAYEPIWAIGTGQSASSDQANEVCGVVRQTVAKLYDQATADSVRVQYGGSVKPANIAELLGKEHIDGALVGGASLESDAFLQLLEAANHG